MYASLSDSLRVLRQVRSSCRLILLSLRRFEVNQGLEVRGFTVTVYIYIHTYTHVYIHTYIRKYAVVIMSRNVPELSTSSVWPFFDINVPALEIALRLWILAFRV